MTKVTVVDWSDMTPGQREYTIYSLAAAYMENSPSWQGIPQEVIDKLDELHDVWAEYEADPVE